MFAGLTPYSSYQSAPESRLPEIPAAWKWVRLASCGDLIRETGRPDLPLLSVYLGRGVIPYAEGGRRVHAPSEQLDAYQVVRPGDLVLNNQQAWRGSVGVSPVTGIVSPAYVIWRASSDIAPQFGTHLFSSPVMVGQYLMASRGVGDIQRDLHMPSLRTVLVPIPPLEDQRAIAKYLIHAGTRIDRAINAKRHLIALLEEMDRAVTNDLAGSIGADGGIEKTAWLGPMPVNWRMVPAKRLFKEVDRRSATGTEGLLSLRMREGLVDADEFTASPIPPKDLIGYKVVLPGEMVMNRMRAAIGLFGVAGTSGLVSPDYSTMTMAPGLLPEFYLWLFKTEAAMVEFRRRSNGLGTGSAGFMRLYYEDFGAIPLPVPPLDEQRRIVEAIERQQAQSSPAISRAQREIALLQEFRARLVDDVVTGRVDVRSIAQTLPEAPDVAHDLGADPDEEREETTDWSDA